MMCRSERRRRRIKGCTENTSGGGGGGGGGETKHPRRVFLCACERNSTQQNNVGVVYTTSLFGLREM